MDLSLAISQALGEAVSRHHQRALLILSSLPQCWTHHRRQAGPCTAPDRVDGRWWWWQELLCTVLTNEIEKQKPCPQRVNVAALCGGCVSASQEHSGCPC